MSPLCSIPALIVLALASASLAQTPATPVPSATPMPVLPVSSPVPLSAELIVALGALDPQSPWAYFEIGEIVSEVAQDKATRTLCRTLYVLAYETSKKQSDEKQRESGSADIRISVCLALAAIADNDSEQRWLRAIASSLGSTTLEGGGTSGTTDGGGAVPDSAALELASALGLVRIGEGRKAAKLLENSQVSQLLDQTERLLSPGGLSGGAQRVRKLMGDWPNCPECKNRRFIKSQEGVRLCPTCGGRPGPKLVQQELLYQLRLESSLLHGVQRSWVAQTIVDGGAPLRDLDPDELAATYRVDPQRTLWRNGVWTAPAGAAKPAASPPDPQPTPTSGG